MHQDVLEFLLSNQLISKVCQVELDVSYANGFKERITQCVITTSEINGKSFNVPFLITKKCSPRVILGRPLLKQMEALNGNSENQLTDPGARCPSKLYESRSATISADSTPVNESTSTPWIDMSGTLPIARLPLLENAHVLPYKEKDRGFSTVDNKIIYSRLIKMAEENKVKQVDPKDCHVILAPVLVDKTEEGPRKFPDPNLHSRYRITVDCRPINEMQLVISETGPAWLLPPPDKKKSAANQSQLSGRSVLQSLPLGNSNTQYGKVDLSDAFSSVRIQESLGRLFSVLVPDFDGTPRAFQWCCLPQGWRHSPYLFTTCINGLLRTLDIQLKQLGVTARHYQDDIILSGDHNLNEAMELLIEHLHMFGFNIQRTKCTWSSPKLIFCGYEIEAGCIKPRPKTPLENTMFDEAWKIFLEGDSKTRYNWIREWCGRFQYWRDFYSPQLSSICLHHLYSFLRNFGEIDSDLKEIDIDQLHDAFFMLIDLCINCVPLPTGLCDTLKNILVVDANCESWGAILFKAIPDGTNAFEHIKSKMSHAPGMDHWVICLEELHKALLATDISAPFTIIPVKMIGGVFTDRQKRASSTHRERMAQLEAFAECRSYLDAPLLIVCDNMNCSLTWHNLDLFGARHLDLWEALQATLDGVGHIWLARTSLPRYADEIARHLSKPIAVTACVANVTDNRDSSNQLLTPIDMTNSISMEDALRRDFIHGLKHDTKSTYRGHSLSEIFRYLNGDIQHISSASMITHRFHLVDGLLMFKSASKDRCVVPSHNSAHILSDKTVDLRAALLHTYHDNFTHPGIFRLYANISRYWYWPGLMDDCKKYVNGCERCRMSTSLQPSGRGEYGSWARKASKVWDMLMIDFAQFENSNILLIIDCYSHWLFTYLTPDQEAKTVASTLRNLFLLIGIPSMIVCDNGTHFVNTIIQNLSVSLGFRVCTGSAYHPQRQGLVERCVREVKTSLRKLDISNLDESLKLVTMMHNISPFSYAVDFSPYTIVYGREVNWLSAGVIDEGYEIDSLRSAWEQCRNLHYDDNNDKSMQVSRKQISPGMRVIFKAGDYVAVKKVVEECGINHWKLTDGRVVPEAQLTPFIDEIPELRITNVREFEIGEVILFHRDDCLDVGRIVEFQDDLARVVNLYMDQTGSWHEHGDNYFDWISAYDIVKKARFTKDRKIDKRILTSI